MTTTPKENLDHLSLQKILLSDQERRSGKTENVAIADISHYIIQGFDFSNMVLDEIFAIGTVFKGCRFQNTSLYGSDFSRCHIIDCEFFKAKLSKSEFFGAKIEGTTFDNCELVRTEFLQVEIKNSTFKNANLEAASICGSTLSQLTFEGSNLEFSDISDNEEKSVTW